MNMVLRMVLNVSSKNNEKVESSFNEKLKIKIKKSILIHGEEFCSKSDNYGNDTDRQLQLYRV